VLEYLLSGAVNPNWITRSPRSAAMPRLFRAIISNLADLDRVFAAVESRAGCIDVMAVNAGVYEFGKLGKITEEQFDKTFNTDVRGVLFTVQKALPLLARTRR
jgi:NAD(P)-dependent dehydrogenase (short-subunit alcohol dehydrogenase family)